MALNNNAIQQRLQEKFGDAVSNFEEPYGMLTFEIVKDRNIELLRYLHDEADLGFRFLTDLTVVHYPAYKDRELAVVYHVHNLVENCRIRFKAFLPIAQPDIQTATVLYEAANWLEREAYDFYGVNFVGHPNLKRIQNVDEMDYFPLRKEYPLEEQTRIDKDDEMFGRGGTLGFGDESTPDHRQTISEADKDNTW